MKKMQEKKKDQQRKKQPLLAVDLGLLLLKIGMILIIFLLLFTTVFGIFRFTGDSHETSRERRRPGDFLQTG